MQVLPQADLETVTERAIRAQVAERFGDGDFKQLVKVCTPVVPCSMSSQCSYCSCGPCMLQEEVERFLTQVAADVSAPAAGAKRKEHPDEVTGGRTKTAKSDPAAAGDDAPLPGVPGRSWRLGPHDKV